LAKPYSEIPSSLAAVSLNIARFSASVNPGALSMWLTESLSHGIGWSVPIPSLSDPTSAAS